MSRKNKITKSDWTIRDLRIFERISTKNSQLQAAKRSKKQSR